MSGFVYIWLDKKHKRYYIGSHWGDQNDGYICSSRWMRNSYRRRPEDFKRRILSSGISDRETLYEEEQRWFNFIKPEEIGKRYYNLTTSVKNHWCQYEDSRLIVGGKISNSQKGKPKKGGKMSEQGKKNVAAAMKLYFSVPENRERLSTQNLGKDPWNKGKKGLQKSWNKGKTTSEETKRKISMSKLGKKHTKKRVYKAKEL